MIDYKFNKIDLEKDDYRKYFTIRAKNLAVKIKNKNSEEKVTTETYYELEKCKEENF